MRFTFEGEPEEFLQALETFKNIAELTPNPDVDAVITTSLKGPENNLQRQINNLKPATDKLGSRSVRDLIEALIYLDERAHRPISIAFKGNVGRSFVYKTEISDGLGEEYILHLD